MDFSKVLGILIRDFQEEEIRYALIGGFALGAWGIVRATMDLDFLVHREDMGKVERVMGKHQYRCAYKSENVSQYVSDLKSLGWIDFLHAFREIALSMLDRADRRPVLGGKQEVRVLVPEDLIGLKVQALANDPSRQHFEYGDIQLLMERFGGKLDWARLGDYFRLFQLGDRYEELKEKYGEAE